MSITIKHLKAFVAVAQTGSFAEAAARVCLSQPAVSVSIKSLEEAVGGRLLARSTRTLALTPEGEAFLPVAQRLLSDWENAIDDLQQRFSLRRGRLEVAAMPSYAGTELPAVLVPFRKAWPDVNIAVHDVIAEDVIERVRQGRVEIGIAFEPPASEDLAFRPLFTDTFLAALPPGSKLARRKTLTWEQLADQPFIVLQRPSSMRSLIEQSLEAAGISLSIQSETNQLATIGRMVAMGLGVSAVPSLCRQQMAEMGVVCRPLGAPEVSRRVGVVTRRRYPLSKPGEALLNLLISRRPARILAGKQP
jgi:LysR family carnitine catabolism transcriptional activator